MNDFNLSRARVLISALVLSAVSFLVRQAGAADEALPTPPQSSALQPSAPPDVRSGGMLQESYFYHRQQSVPVQPMRSAIERGGIPQANGWTNYGFPMQSYRWGYFGAERHHPYVMWHQGYYGDQVRTAYRAAY